MSELTPELRKKFLRFPNAYLQVESLLNNACARDIFILPSLGIRQADGARRTNCIFIKVWSRCMAGTEPSYPHSTRAAV
ncbi:MAG: hypothetical protein ABI539_02470 [Acidobacteriota bacterium]